MKKDAGQIGSDGDNGGSGPQSSALPAKRKRGRKLLLLEPLVKQTILDSIRAGAFHWTAAVAAGVGVSTYFRWMKIGAKHDAEGRNSPYRELWEEVQRASGEARVRMEIRVAQASPSVWLRCGPGKSKPGREGWTEIIEVQTPEGGDFKIMHQMEEGQLGRVLDILQDAGAIPPPPGSSDDHHGAGECSACATPPDGAGEAAQASSFRPDHASPAPAPDPPDSPIEEPDDPPDRRLEERARRLREGSGASGYSPF